VTIAQVDDARKPIPGTEKTFECDTVLLSVGLIPENELSKKAGIRLDSRTNGPEVFENLETSIPGIFACGNVVHVHDLVDNVTNESQRAGKAAAQYILTGKQAGEQTGIQNSEENDKQNGEEAIKLVNGDGVSYTVPQKIRISHVDNNTDIYFRVNRVYGESLICILCRSVEIARFKRQHLAPGEMEHIALPKALLDQCVSEGKTEITISAKSLPEHNDTSGGAL
jgi:hypothetical protein